MKKPSIAFPELVLPIRLIGTDVLKSAIAGRTPPFNCLPYRLSQGSIQLLVHTQIALDLCGNHRSKSFTGRNTLFGV